MAEKKTKTPEGALDGFQVYAEPAEEDKKLRRRASRIRKAMLNDLQARGLLAAKTGGKVGTGRSEWGYASQQADAFAEAGQRSTGRKGSGSRAERESLGAVYADMVEDYVALWITREKLERDIAERGVTVMDEKRGLPVENCSVSARVRVSKQMTTIMQTLGYKDQAIKARRPEGDFDDEL